MPQPSTNFSDPLDMQAMALSQADVDLLITEGSAEARVNVLDKISSHYANKSFHEREFMFAEQIFRLLMKDTEIKVRQALAQRVKNNPDIPRDIVLHLAKDVEQVAMPVLEMSQVLSDADLIQIIDNSRGIGKLIAIAKRARVSDRVSHALVETHYPQVVKSLLDNSEANISDQDYAKILEDFSHEEVITHTLAGREQLPFHIVEKLIHHVSENLAAQLEEKYQIDFDAVRPAASEQITLEMVPYDASDEEIATIVAQMLKHDRLSPSIILSSLCRGHIRFFETALAHLANLPLANARKLVRDRGPLGFQAIYHKTGLPESMFQAVRILLQVVLETHQTSAVSPGTQAYSNQLVQTILIQAGNEDIENLSYIIALVRQSAA